MVFFIICIWLFKFALFCVLFFFLVLYSNRKVSKLSIGLSILVLILS